MMGRDRPYRTAYFFQRHHFRNAPCGLVHLFWREHLIEDAGRIREAQKQRVARVWHDVVENNGREARLSPRSSRPELCG
jgi:hypothetical protein